ncbi:MAG: hypothetical protein GY802_09550 [Gammaproteobacteria bacterium]|nr:hypothetical protein [Gammaproteobacteria bacterium]
MQFTFQFVKYFAYGLELAAPLLLFLALLIVTLGQIVGLHLALGGSFNE